MKININDYAVGKATVQNWYLQNGDGKIVQSISIMGASYLIPCLVVAFWIGEITDWHEDALNNIDVLIKDYNYTEIIGIPDSYPKKNSV